MSNDQTGRDVLIRILYALRNGDSSTSRPTPTTRHPHSPHLWYRTLMAEQEDHPQDADSGSAPGGAAPELRAQVAEVLEQIRPAIQDDGGDIELIDVNEEGVVSIRFLGACIGCPSSEITLRDGIARNLRERIPAVTDVRSIS